MITNLHEETTEDDVLDALEYQGAKVTNLHLNLDKQTGYCIGYALAELESLEECQKVLSGNDDNQLEIMGNKINIDFAFTKLPEKKIGYRFDRNYGRAHAHAHAGRDAGYDRNRSPVRS
ncbi:unnamed protein product [Ambrosiozyma monospora]|uniref:Unnamed protein product n=1 Tax=Ambrosiozyma monospora TaxID=43982 RepID=A0ACB5SSW9_AMBMO|nr:unnamed protein product [Ambrosiozyma monospora]